MRTLKNILLILPVRIYLKLLESCFSLDTIFFKSKHHLIILEHYKKVVTCETNRWFWKWNI